MVKRKWNWKNVSLPDGLAESAAGSFEREVYESALPGDPENLELLIALGDLYTKQGLLEKGLAVDQKLVRMRPDVSIFHYNLACSHSLLGQLDPALKALKEAVKLGYDDLEHLQGDKDLDNVKSDNRFAQIVERIERKLKS